jgi:hypothetical protein
MVQHADIDHTGLTGIGAGGALIGQDSELRTGGDLSVTSTVAGTAIPTLPTLTVPASAGDLLLIGLDCVISSTGGIGLRLDVGTIVAAAVVNYLSNLTGTPATIGLPGWGAAASTQKFNMGAIRYVVQAGDISGGNVELGLRAWNSGAGTRTVQASTSSPLAFLVMNLGQ